MDTPIILIEEFLFRNEKFHKQKLLFHRLSMKSYELFLTQKGLEVFYIESINPDSDIRKLLPKLNGDGCFHQFIFLICMTIGLTIELKKHQKRTIFKLISAPIIIFSMILKITLTFLITRRISFHNSFYVKQRKDNQILIENEEPIGGRWSFDHDNRKKYPKDKTHHKYPIYCNRFI